MARTRVAVAVLLRDERVLLGHRHPSRRSYPDCWDLVGGHVEPGETAPQALVRECREELGVAVLRWRPVSTTDIGDEVSLHAFAVTAWDGEPVNAAPEEHDDLRWFAPAELSGLHLAHPSCLEIVRAAVRVVHACPP